MAKGRRNRELRKYAATQKGTAATNGENTVKSLARRLRRVGWLAR